eukprot:403377277
MEANKEQDPVPTQQEEQKTEQAQPKQNTKHDKEKKKQERLAARQKKTVEEEYKKDPNDPSAALFGELELNRSQSDPELRYARTFTSVKELTEEHNGQEVLVRARLHATRGTGKMCFLVVREQFATVQAVLSVNDQISKGMVTFTSKIPKESIIDIKATVTIPEKPVQTCSQKVELQIKEIWVVNKSVPMLPFQLDDASRKVENQEDEEKQQHAEESKDGKLAVVGQDVRLNNRIIDLRVPANQALMRLQSAVGMLFREFLYTKDFIEIHSPKLIGGTSEGGANVFRLNYFDQEACLAQSPQLYKQMVLCGDMQRVFEIGPVFRAEDSNTNRHLCEFTGLDIEMVFKEHYFEILDLLADLFVHIFQGLEERFGKELQSVKDQYHFEPFKCKLPVVRLNFKEAVKMLDAAGYTQEPLQDLSTLNEQQLGRLVREQYDTDFYMLYGYPTNARPFYTMLDPHDPNYTNSYDFFMRGEEITSGAQRIHESEFLAERATAHNIPVATIQDYIDSFKYGAPPHGGCGIGLERVVKLYCGIRNIRKCSLFPRDPKRLKP